MDSPGKASPGLPGEVATLVSGEAPPVGPTGGANPHFPDQYRPFTGTWVQMRMAPQGLLYRRGVPAPW